MNPYFHIRLDDTSPGPAPAIDPELVYWLNKLFPDRCPDPNDSEREVWIKAGARRVVDKLLFELARQDKGKNHVLRKHA
jgi:hypothetical protein